MTKEANPYDAVNLEADQVVDRYISPEIVRHVNCGCHQCMMQAQALCNNWLAGVDADWVASVIQEYERSQKKQ